MTIRWSDIARMALPALAFVPGMAPFIGPIMLSIGEADALFTDKNDKHNHVVNIVKTTAETLAANNITHIDPDTAVDITEDVFRVIDQLHDTVKDAPTHGTDVDVSPDVPLPPPTE